MGDKKQRNKLEEESHYIEGVNLRSILRDAIRMQALYSGRRVKIVETSTSSN